MLVTLRANLHCCSDVATRPRVASTVASPASSCRAHQHHELCASRHDESETAGASCRAPCAQDLRSHIFAVADASCVAFVASNL